MQKFNEIAFWGIFGNEIRWNDQTLKRQILKLGKSSDIVKSRQLQILNIHNFRKSVLLTVISIFPFHSSTEKY